MWETYKKEELETKLNTNFLKGLKFEEAKKRQMKYGKNELENKKKDSPKKSYSNYEQREYPPEFFEGIYDNLRKWGKYERL